MSLNNILDKDGKPISVDYVEVKSLQDMEAAYHYLKNDKHGYECVVVDSLTEIQKVVKDHILEAGKRDQMQIADWGALSMKLERMVRAFRDLPLHVVITALEETETDKITGEVKVYPALQGGLQKQLPAYFDLVLYMYAKEVVADGGSSQIKFFALTKNSGKYIGKDRSGKLPSIIQEPTFPKVYDLIFNQQTKGDK